MNNDKSKRKKSLNEFLKFKVQIKVKSKVLK